MPAPSTAASWSCIGGDRGAAMKRTRDRFSDKIRTERFTGGLESAIGMPSDPDSIPEVRYQVLGDKVFLLQSWRNGSTVRGEVETQTLANLMGGAIPQEGWYDAAGTYLGPEPDLGWLEK